MPGPCCTRLPAAPEMFPPKTTLSERAKASVPLLIVTFPAMLPVVPPLPTCSVPPLTVEPAQVFHAAQRQRVRALLDHAARAADVAGEAHIVGTGEGQRAGVDRHVAGDAAGRAAVADCSVPLSIVVPPP